MDVLTGSRLGGGIILYLLYAARTFDDRRLLELAMRGAIGFSSCRPGSARRIKVAGISPLTPALVKLEFPPTPGSRTSNSARLGWRTSWRAFTRKRVRRVSGGARAGAKHIQSIATYEASRRSLLP